MAEYLTTREVARYLRLNEKKVYALVAEGKLPAARISGKWLFPRHVVDAWVDKHTRLPCTGLMGGLLDEGLVVVQGSDDWVLSRLAERFHDRFGTPIVSSGVGSLAGLSAVRTGKAHLAGCHVASDLLRRPPGAEGEGCVAVNLFTREQALLFDRRRHPDIEGLCAVHERGLRFAVRQTLSGTFLLVERLLAQEAGAPMESLRQVGPYATHMEVALAIRAGRADAGVATAGTAEMSGLDFVRLCSEPFRLVVPASLSSHPQIMRLLDFVLEDLRALSASGVGGYGFEPLGRVELIG